MKETLNLLHGRLLYPAIPVLVILLFFLVRRRRNRDRLPPGPKGVFLLGNALQMPREREWLTYAKWSEKYGSCLVQLKFETSYGLIGDLVYLNLLGQHFMIVDTYEVAHDLLNKRSAIYSTRPHLVSFRVLWRALSPQTIIQTMAGELYVTSIPHSSRSLPR